MTSTNDGKDVKSNQTSGHKGKSYYIELYKSLEKHLNGDNSLEARTTHVCEAWRRVYSLYQHSAPSTHPHLLSWLQRHTAHTVLQSKWAESKNEHARLTAAIDALVAEAQAASAGREQQPWEKLLLQRASWFRKTLANPWGHPVLKSLIDPKGEPVTDQQVLEWLVEERGIVLVTRLRQLVSAGNCDDLALLLASAVMDRARAAIPRRSDDQADLKMEEQEDLTTFVAVLERDASFTVDVWELLTDIELVLLLKRDKRPHCIQLAKLTPLRHGYSLVERLRNRLETSPRDKKLWKHAKEAATIVAQVIIARCMVLSTCAGVGRAALYCCARALARLVPAARLPAVSGTLAAPAATARHLHTFCAALDAQCSENMKPFICELYVRAITAGMNELERLKLNADKANEARSSEQTLASWFTQLGALLTGSARLRAECALTAFSVHPARNLYERVAAMTPPARLNTAQEPTPESTSEFGSWANDSRTQSNLVKTSETLQLKKTEQHQANVLSTAILTEGETLGLEPELCQDLAVLLSGPRVKTLSWDMDREVLLENCRAYMERTHGGTRAVTTELKYLNLDPNAYRHLPEEGDDETDPYYGIEKGYEDGVQLEDTEEIWQNDAYFDPERTDSANDSEVEILSKKKFNSSDDDEDPLSSLADAKKEQKRLAKEKRKEQRRKKTHQRDTSKDSSRERRKDKDKKTKKVRKKDKSDQPATGSLTSLLGMKVSNMPSQVQDGQKRVRKKKERRRDTMFSYVSVTESDYDNQERLSLASGNDPNIVVDGVFSMDELKSPERRTEDNLKLIDIMKPTSNTSSLQSPVINDIKSRPKVSSPRIATSDDSDVSRSKSPYLTPNQVAHRHVVSDKVKSSINKLLKFRRESMKMRPLPKNASPAPKTSSPAPNTSSQPRPISDTKTIIPNPSLLGIKVHNSEEVPKVIMNRKQFEQLEAIQNEVNNLLTIANEGISTTVNDNLKIPCNDTSDNKLNPHVCNVQKQTQHYNSPELQKVNESQRILSEHVQSSPIKRVQNPIYMTSPTSTSVIHTNYTSPTKTEHMKPQALNLTQPNPTMAQQPLHRSMHNLSTDTKHEVPKKPVIINDPSYFSQQHAKNASKTSPRIISNTCIKPPNQTVAGNRLYPLTNREDLLKNSQNNSDLTRIISKGSAQNVNSTITNVKNDFITYGQRQLSTSMQNVNDSLGACNDVTKRHVPTPTEAHGRTSQPNLYSGTSHSDLSTPQAYYASNCAPSSRGSIQNRERVDVRTQLKIPPVQKKPTVGIKTNYDNFFKDLARTINAGSKYPEGYTVTLNKEVKVTPLQTPSKRVDSVIPHCAKQPIQQKKTDNAPNTFSRRNYMHKNKQSENKVNLSDAIAATLNKNIMDNKFAKAMCLKNELTISRVGSTSSVQDQVNASKHEQSYSMLQKNCPVLSSMLESPGPSIPRTTNVLNTSLNSSESQTDREHADLLLLLRQQPIIKPNTNTTVTLPSEITSSQTPNNMQTKIDSSKNQTLLGAKIKNINKVLGNMPAVQKEYLSEEPQEWKRVMDNILAHKTEPLGPNALDIVLNRDRKHPPSSLRSHTSHKPRMSGQSSSQNKSSDSKKREHHSSKCSSSSRKLSIEKHSDTPKRHRQSEVKKVSSTEMLKGQNKQGVPNSLKGEDPFIPGIPNSAYDMLGDLMDDDLRQELGELSSDEDTYNATKVPGAKQKSDSNIPKTNACRLTTVAKQKLIVDPKSIIFKNPANSNRTATCSASGYTNVITNNSSHIGVATLPESRPTVVCANTEQLHTATVINNPIVQHTANVINHNIESSHFVNTIESPNVIITSVPAQPVVVIRQDLVYDPYPTIRIHESQMNAGLCSVNQNVYALNSTPNIAVYQTTQFAAPVINPVIIGNAMTTNNVSNTNQTENQQFFPDSVKADVKPETTDTKNIANCITEYNNKTPEKSTNLDFNMNKNCERKVLSQVQEKHPNEHINKESNIGSLCVDDNLIKTEQDEERIKLKRQSLMNRKICHPCFHPPIPLTYTPLSEEVNLEKLIQQEPPKNGTLKAKLTPSNTNGINKCVPVNTTVTDPLKCETNNENIESTKQASDAKENKKSCRRIWLRSSNKLENASLVTHTTIPLRRNKIKIKVPENVIEKVTDLENENKDNVKIPTRISSRILSKTILSKPDGNKPPSSEQVQENDELIDFEEELSGSKILKTITTLESEQQSKKLVRDITYENNDTTTAAKTQDFGMKQAKPCESHKLLNKSLEPTVVLEKLRTNLGDQLLIKSVPVKMLDKEPNVTSSERLGKEPNVISSETANYTILSKKGTTECVTETICATLKNVTEKAAPKITRSTSIATPLVDKTDIVKPIAIKKLNVANQTEITNEGVSATMQPKKLTISRKSLQVFEIDNCQPKVVINKINLLDDTKPSHALETIPIEGISIAANVVQSISATSVIKSNVVPNSNRTSQPQLIPALNTMKILPELQATGNKVALTNTHTIVHDVASQSNDNSKTINQMDPKFAAPLPSLLATDPAEITRNNVTNLPASEITPNETTPEAATIQGVETRSTINKIDLNPSRPPQSLLKTVDPAPNTHTLDSVLTASEITPNTEKAKPTVRSMSTRSIAKSAIINQTSPKSSELLQPHLKVVIPHVKTRTDDQKIIEQPKPQVLPKAQNTDSNSVIRIGYSPGKVTNREQQKMDLSKPILCKDISSCVTYASTKKSDEGQLVDFQPTTMEQQPINLNKTIQDKNNKIIQEPKLQSLRGINVTESKSANAGKTQVFTKGDLKIEELPLEDGSDPNKKFVRITLPNGKVFKATIFGNIHGDFDSLFAQPTMRSLLSGGIKDGKRYTVNYKQVSKANKDNPTKILDTKIKEMNIMEAQLPIDTVNLISDDEDEVESQSFVTEFGKYKTSVDQDVFTKHQNKFSQKCIVKLYRKTIYGSNKTKPKLRPLPSVKTSLLTRTQNKLVSDPPTANMNTELDSNTKNDELPPICISSSATLTPSEGTPTSSLEQVDTPTILKIPNVIEIDDSSNGSVENLTSKSDNNENAEPVNKILKLKSLLLQDLGVAGISEAVKDIKIPVQNKPLVEDLKNALLHDLGVISAENPIIDITNTVDDSANSVIEAENPIVNIENSVVNYENSVMTVENPAVTPEKPVIHTDNPVTDVDDSAIDIEKSIIGIEDTVIDITPNDKGTKLPSEVQKEVNLKDCVVRITRCETLIKKYKLLRTMKNCYVSVERIDNFILGTDGVFLLNDEVNHIDPLNQDNSDDFIEFDGEENFRSPQLSRYPSLSILNNWGDEYQPLEIPYCSSPVMEIFDTIVQISNKFKRSTKFASEYEKLFIYTCESEWRVTKIEYRNQEILHISDLQTVKNDQSEITLTDTIQVSDDKKLQMAFEAPNLSIITLKFFEDNPHLINRLLATRKIKQSRTYIPTNILKRKPEECVHDIVSNKILKLGTLALNAFNSGSKSFDVNAISKIELNISNQEDTVHANLQQPNFTSVESAPSPIKKCIQVEEPIKKHHETLVYVTENKDNIHSTIKNEVTKQPTAEHENLEQITDSIVFTNTENNTQERGKVFEVQSIGNKEYLSSSVTINQRSQVIEVICEDINMNEDSNIVDADDSSTVNERYILYNDKQIMDNIKIEPSAEESGSIEDTISRPLVVNQTNVNILKEESVPQDDTTSYTAEANNIAQDQSNLTTSVNIQETILNPNIFEKTNTASDNQNDAEDQNNTSTETVSDDIEPLHFKTEITIKSKLNNLNPEIIDKLSKADHQIEDEKFISPPLHRNMAKTCDEEIPLNTTEPAGNYANIVDIVGGARLDEIHIDDLPNKAYEVEIVDTNIEDGIDIKEILREQSPDIVALNTNNPSLQENDLYIKSPVFVDSTEIIFNYHDYTKQRKKTANTSSLETQAVNNDNDHLNEENATISDVKNAPSNEHPCLEVRQTEHGENYTITNHRRKTKIQNKENCKYELIQEDDWLTVIKTENGKEDNETIERDDTVVVASLCSKDTTINIKGFEYDDVYVFPLNESESTSNTSSDSTGQELNTDVIKSVNDFVQDDLHDINYGVIAPKVTYSRKYLKRKMDMRDFKVTEKKYRKGKNIDCSKLTVSSMTELAYGKEYKRLLEYCSSVKFSYSRPFHKECLEVDDMVSKWPINNNCGDTPGDVADECLFVDIQEEEEDSYQPDPATQTLAEEISYEYDKTIVNQEDPSHEAGELNFNMGFGEGSGRVIQILKKGGESNISAATLSDVKQSQPVFKSVELDCNDLRTNKDDQIKKIRQHVNFIELRDKVRSFFKKSSVELKSYWIQENIKDADVKSGCNDRFNAEEFPFDLCSLDYVKPLPTETIVQVVQVGQLPVSAAAQNPVTCDPRVTQVSDASPSQCSVDNSPNDDSQSEIKTEYTELTTADLSLPLQDYAQQNQAMNLASHDSKLELTEQTISLEMEIKAEESPKIKEEMPDITEEKSNSSDTELHTLTNATPENLSYSFENNTAKSDACSVIYDSSEQNSSETFSQQRQQNGTSEKTDQIAHAMNAAGITTTPETITNTRAHALVNILSQKIRQGSINNTQTTTNTYSKTTSINAMALQQALAQILPPPLNQTGSSENNQTQSTPIGPQVLHIVQGKNASGNQITLVDNSQQSVISTPNATQVLHIVQNKGAAAGQASNGTLTSQSNSFSGISLVDAGLQQGGNQLLHIVNTGSQKTANPGQLLKRVNLLTNLTNVQGSNEQKMVQFVCKSADGKAIQLNAPHQRSMVLRLQPIETPSAKPAETQDLSSSPTGSATSKESASQQEIKSRSIYEENYAKFIQNSSSKTPGLEKSTSLPKFNQAFGKPVFQEGTQKQGETANNNAHIPSVNTNTENAECTATDNAINLEHIGQISSPPLLLRKQPAVTSQSQQNIVQQIKQTIAPMNIQTMHGGVIYTRQIPVNIGGGQTINLITVPSTELINDDTPKPQTQTNQSEIEPSIIKIVPQTQTTTNTESSLEDNNNHASGSSENTPTLQPQPVLTQMRIKLPMLSKAPQMVPGARVVRPSFFQIQRNVISGTNQPVYQQLVLTAAPPLGQQTIRLPQAQVSRSIKVPSESQSSSSESQMSSSTLEQLREFDMVLEQVKERSTVQPNTNSNNSSFKIQTSSSDTTDGNGSSSCSTESTPQVLYSIGNNQSLNVAYVNRKTTVTTPTTSTFVRSPDSTGIADSPTSSTHVQIPHTVTTDSSPTEMSSQSKPAKVGSKSKSRPKSTSNPPNTLKLNSSVPPKTSSQKPLEDEQTTQRILYILAEYKEQVENSPDKDKPAPRRRSNPPSNPGSSKRKKSSSSRRSGTRDMSPIHGEDTCRTMGSEDSSCGTSQGDCAESCLDSHSPQDSPRKVARKITFDQDLTVTQPRTQPQRNVIVADGQTITVARGATGKPATAVLMPANYILPVSMVKGGQQIAIVTNRGPKLLTVGGEGGATNALLLQRLIGPAGLKPVLARPGVRHVRLPTAALHNLQAFNLATATTVQPPDSTASPTPGPTPPELVDTRATSSPWTDRDSNDVKPERGSSPEGSEPWNLPSSADAHEYSYEETVRTDNMDRTVLDPIPDRYSPDMEAQRIFDKMFDVDSKKSYAVGSHDDSPRCAYDIDPSDCDDKAYQVVQKKDGTHRQHRLSHVSAAALRHKYAILEHELRLQKSLSEECEDLGVDSPSASELFPEAELLFAASPAHEHNQDAHHPHTPQPHQSSIPQPDMDDQIATDHLIPREIDVSLGLGDVGIVAVSEDGMQATIALDQEEFARSHPNTTFHSEPTEGEVQPFTITGIKGRHITSTIFHSNSAPATVLMAAPQATVISQAPDHGVKYEIENMINSIPSSHNNDINLSSVLVKDDGLTRFDSILTDSRELHLTNTASAIVHSSGNATQVIRRVCYEDDKRERDARYLIDEPDNLIAGDDAKMIAEDSSRDATLESMADVDDDRSSPERHAELFWESNSASERSESRRPLDFSSDSDKCCKSPSFDETNSTDSSGVGTHMRLDSVIKEARGRERSGSADGSSADDAHPPLRTYPPKRSFHPLEGDAERSLSGKTRAGERSPDSLEVRRRASGRGVVKRGCHCCNGSPAPPRPKKPRQRKPALDFANS